MDDVVSEHHQSKASNVLGGKTARACDSCLVKRARWFCPGDDAFLCQVCDNSVHSANPLASRHKRVRLELSPSWHQYGFTRKARTPRQTKTKAPSRLEALSNHLVVPELVSEDPENEEQLFCRVPVFDSFSEELHDFNLEEMFSNCDDVERFLGFENNADDEFFSHVKEEEKDDALACHFDPSLDVKLNWDFGVDREEDMKTSKLMEIESESDGMLLRLDYEAVVAAWATQGSPWMDGIRPHCNLDQFMVACMESGISHEWGGGGDRLSGANIAGREARVSRYREKRRTRLFSKKIRYEVRKLNAEKRPRMKGRFVKRTTFSGSSLPYQLINK